MYLIITGVSSRPFLFKERKQKRKHVHERQEKRSERESTRNKEKQKDKGLWRVNRDIADESLKMLRDFLEVIGCLCGLRFL